MLTTRQPIDISASKLSLVHGIFVHPADASYITARWSALNHLSADFLALSAHSLENYMKAILLLNGRPVHKYGRDLNDLYRDVKKIAGTLLPNRVVESRNFFVQYLYEVSDEEFFSQLYGQVEAHSRYAVDGFAVLSQDLHMFDQMVFALRRLIWPLDEPVPGDGPEAPAISRREQLLADRSFYSSLGAPLDELVAARDDTPARMAALNHNVAFAPSDFPHGPVSVGSWPLTPVVERCILEPLEGADPQAMAEAVAAADWLVANVKLADGILDKIKDARKAAKAKAPAKTPAKTVAKTTLKPSAR
jgi:hypothetical protein